MKIAEKKNVNALLIVSLHQIAELVSFETPTHDAISEKKSKERMLK